MTSRLAGYFTQPTPSFWRSLRHLADSRILVVLLLFVYVPFVERNPDYQLPFDRTLFIGSCSFYLVAGIFFSAWARFNQSAFQIQLLTQIAVDIVMISLITSAAGGIKSGLGVLMITPTAGAAILSTQPMALFIAAAASLAMLGEGFWRLLVEDTFVARVEGELFIAAAISTTLFILVLLVNLLARRLNTQESLAERRGADLRNQVAINELVIAELGDGVVVLESDGALKALNPKARRILGGNDEVEILARNRRGLETLRALAASSQVTSEISMMSPSGDVRRLRARVLAVPDEGDRPACDRVVLLEDLADLDERAQQLKLASMGRMSASIAHEIRNPLGAIRHAGGLLSEQLAEPRLSRLTQIIETNSVRIDRIIEDVLAIARRSVVRESIDLPAFFSVFLPEFIDQSGTFWERVTVELDLPAEIQFDPNHLRQVMVNLVGNALRYASRSEGAILVRWSLEFDDQLQRPLPRLRVFDDGPGVPPEQREMLFEPFFTTSARGTGLGLHMAREYCQANGAQLRYEARPDPGAGEPDDVPPGADLSVPAAASPARTAPRYSGSFVIEPLTTDPPGQQDERRPGGAGASKSGWTWQQSMQTA